MEEAPGILKMSRTNNVETNNKEKENSSKSIFKERVESFEAAIYNEVDFDKLRELSFGGIPDSPGLRSICWKLLLGYLPNERKIWKEILEQKRNLYQEFCVELCIDPRKKETLDDHPLSTSSSSQWNAFFKDKEFIEEFDKDVKRTLPHLHFFNHDKSIGSTEHYEALKRILFIYGKLNPGIKYVQGMNEILGPIYYIFATDPDIEFKNNSEADTFFCFTNLMSEIRDNFCKSLDKSTLGIMGLINKFNTVLNQKDPELWKDFEEKNLNPQYYSFRWLTLLLSQEFDLPDVLRLWDSLFADSFRFQFLLYVCTAMLICVREQLLDGSFADNLKMIQHYPLQDIHIILSKAEEIFKDDYVPPSPRIKPLIIHQQNENLTNNSWKNNKVITGFKFFQSEEKITGKIPVSHPFEDRTKENFIHEEVSSNRGEMLVPPKPFEENIVSTDFKKAKYIFLSEDDEPHEKTHPLE